jgi:endonuclease/exonuclease/phosphatase family metal-dependent hydrolase
MSPDHDPGETVSRRSVLGGVGGLLGAAARPPLGSATPGLTVMTRNLYLGVDLTRLFAARTEDDVRRITGELLADVRRRSFPARAEAIAREIEAHAPDVVGVQEATLVQVQRASEQDSSAADASVTVLDFLDVLLEKLAARGVEYEPAVSTRTTDVELPTEVGGRRIDVRLADRDVLLVRSSLETRNARSGTFEAELTVPAPGRTITVQRGFCLADVRLEPGDVTVATTHLESVSADVRRRQARELRDRLPADDRLVLVGDFNSGPGGRRDAYDDLTDSFTDAYEAMHPGAEGVTCCQDADLRNDESQLSRRIDGVLAGGGVRPTAAERTGHEPGDRLTTEIDGQQVQLWPSDHAGVVASLAPGRATGRSATPTGVPPSAASTTEVRAEGGTGAAPETDRSSPTSARGDGLGAVAGLAALVGVALARLRRE